MSLEPIHLEVGDKHLRIPKAYMDYRPNWKGGKQDGAGMQVILPDMKPFGADTIEEFKKPGHANKFRVLINEGGIVKKNEATERKIAKTYQRIRGLAKSSKERNFDGLVENNTCFFTKRDKKTDYFVGIQTDYSVIEFRRSRHKDVPHPSCSTIRNYSRLTFLTYHFSRDHLPRWREIDATVFKLIKSFEFDANTVKPQ